MHAGRLVLAAFLASATLAAGPSPFHDVPDAHWASREVRWLREAGLVQGWKGAFHGERSFTRYEMAKILYRFMQRFEGARAHFEGELDEVRRADAAQDARLASLFESGGEALPGSRGSDASAVRLARLERTVADQGRRIDELFRSGSGRASSASGSAAVEDLLGRLRAQASGRDQKIADLERQLATLRSVFADLSRRVDQARAGSSRPPAPTRGTARTASHATRTRRPDPPAPTREALASPTRRIGPAGTPPETPRTWALPSDDPASALPGDAAMLTEKKAMVVIPPTGGAEVVEIVDGKRTSRTLGSGLHRVAIGATVRVPTGGAAAVWYPTTGKRFTLLEDSEVVVRADGVLRVSGRMVASR